MNPDPTPADTSAAEPQPPSEAEYWGGVAQQLGLDYFVLSRAARELINHLPDGEYVGLGELRTALKSAAPPRISVEELAQRLQHIYFGVHANVKTQWEAVARAALAALSQPSQNETEKEPQP